MRKALPDFRAHQPAGRELLPQHPHLPWRAMLLGGTLWLMLWGGYNTDIRAFSDPDFRASGLTFFHALRSLLPLTAGYLAGVILIARRDIPKWLLQGPLGLLALYTLTGVVSSLVLSREPLIALYWAWQYASVLLVVFAALGGSNPEAGISQVIKLNWIIVAVIAASVLSMVAFDPSLVLRPGGLLQHTQPSWGDDNPDQVFGMTSSRSTGVARYAAVVALVALGRIWQAKGRLRIIWSPVLVVCLSSIVYLQARGALVSFLAGTFALLWLRRSSRRVFIAMVPVAGVLLGATGAYGAFWDWFTKGGSFDATSMLTGRTDTWRDGLELFQGSPLLGFGFHADRIFLDQHMHDALLHVMVQTGLVGAIPFMAAMVYAGVLILRLYRTRPHSGEAPLPAEIPGVVIYFIVASFSESTVAFYGAAWLLVAPCLAYLQVLTRQRRLAHLRQILAQQTKLPRRPPSLVPSTARRGSQIFPEVDDATPQSLAGRRSGLTRKR